jgi:hypothetical protein
MIDANLRPNRLVIECPFENGFRNEIKFIFDPRNQFIWRGNFLVCNLLLDMAEEKEIRQCQIRRENTAYPRNAYLNYFLIITHQ